MLTHKRLERPITVSAIAKDRQSFSDFYHVELSNSRNGPVLLVQLRRRSEGDFLTNVIVNLAIPASRVSKFAAALARAAELVNEIGLVNAEDGDDQ
jgi:hypothetical protein